MKIKMNSKITLAICFLCCLVFSCKKEDSFSNFKYADKPIAIECAGVNTKLLNEALYSFEDDITNHYKQNRPNFRIEQAYSQIIRNSVYGRLQLDKMVSEHTFEVFQALKKEEGLWDMNSSKSKLNYNSTAVKCISNTINDDNLKTTLNALLTTNSMSPKLFGPAIVNKFQKVINDKSLALYIALDLYYAKMFDFNFAKAKFEQPEQKVDFNQVPRKVEEIDPHAGHNHD
jgi:hypothetical protein